MATIGTYVLTAIGTLPVLLVRSVPRRLMDAMMGFAAGVMTAAAGAMLYVVVEELIPETVRAGAVDVATLGFISGFTVMMVLDNALG